MALSNAAAQAIVETWSLSAKTPFSASEQSALVDALVALSADVTVHIVPDITLSEAEQTLILSDRALACLNDWIAIVARTFRSQFNVTESWRDAQARIFPVGLKSASRQERIDLPVLGAQLSDRLANYLALTPQARFDDLENVSGLGPAGLNKLRESSYLDRPTLGILSLSLLGFVDRPSVDTLLQVFDTSDWNIVYGDWVTHRRRDAQAASATSALRLRDFITFVADQLKATPFVARGVLASEALATAKRQIALNDRRETASTGGGELVVNDAYVETALSVIEAATTRISLMVFLGTDASPIAEGVAPDVLIDALETANGSADVRVILDQDDLDDPYLSKAINMPLFNRLKSAGVAVKFDEKNVLLHSKLLIADGATALVGSHNWTRSSFNGTHEISLLVQEPGVAQAYQDRFDAMWSTLPD
ncbi:MAG: phospholipase D-like domain-containing protein [Pseudomonadota bacterium]